MLFNNLCLCLPSLSHFISHFIDCWIPLKWSCYTVLLIGDALGYEYNVLSWCQFSITLIACCYMQPIYGCRTVDWVSWYTSSLFQRPLFNSGQHVMFTYTINMLNIALYCKSLNCTLSCADVVVRVWVVCLYHANGRLMHHTFLIV